LLLGLKKAFDTVCHEILLNKLKIYGIRGVAKNSFASFLKNRYQYVTINSCNSSKININYGVPQGSVLGLLLFLLYINDLPNCTASSLKLYADDTCLIVTGNSIENLKRKVSEDLENISSWLNANKLTLNHTISNIIIVPPKSNTSSTNVADTFQGSQIFVANDAKYLEYLDVDLILDKDLFIISFTYITTTNEIIKISRYIK